MGGGVGGKDVGGVGGNEWRSVVASCATMLLLVDGEVSNMVKTTGADIL